MKYFNHLDSLGFIDEQQGEFGTFHYLDVNDRTVSLYKIPHAEELALIQQNEVENVKEMTIIDFLKEDIQNKPSYLYPHFKSTYSYDLFGALGATLQEGIKRNIYFTDVENLEMNQSANFEAIIKSHCFFVNR